MPTKSDSWDFENAVNSSCVTLGLQSKRLKTRDTLVIVCLFKFHPKLIKQLFRIYPYDKGFREIYTCVCIHAYIYVHM